MAFLVFQVILICLFSYILLMARALAQDVEEDSFFVYRKGGVAQCVNSTPTATVPAKSRMQCSKQCQQRGRVCFGANFRSTIRSCDIYYSKTSFFKVVPGCEYLQRRPRPCTEVPARSYKLNITANTNLQNLYIDGQAFTVLPNSGSSFTPDVASYSVRPTVIAAKVYSSVSTQGLLASDSEGHVTDSSWKCTDTLYTNWFLTSYDDSAWPAALVLVPQLNESDVLSMNNPTTTPVSTISLRANWIWSVWNPTTRIAYCRLRLSTTDDSCCTVPCYNGAACVPYGDTTAFTCQCPAGFAGSTCEQVVNAGTTSYQINLTSSASLVSFYADGQSYIIPNSGNPALMGSLSLNYLPSVIGVVGYRGASATTFGTLASDSAGYVTDTTWKCTMYYHTDWMLPSFDDSSWPAAMNQTANGDEETAPASVAGVDNRAQWIWASDYILATQNVAYCRLRLDPEGNACYSYPCKNGGTCTDSGGSFTCSCPAGTVMPTCRLLNQTYQVNVTAYANLYDFYVDGIRQDLVAADMNDWSRESVVNLDFLPTVIAVYAYSIYKIGVLASDSIGTVTDASWKCSRIVHANWMLPSFDDSAWPAPTIYKINGDRKVWLPPVYDISNRAQWIWPTDGLSSGDYGHCRLRLPTIGNACYSSPCKNGGTCTNVGPSFTCNCPAGTVGPVCKILNFTYELNITANDQWFNLYFDGIEYLVGENAGNKVLQYTYDSIQADFRPSVIAIYFNSDENHGVVASDSVGIVTDESWKCTMNPYADFMLTSFDDSAWPKSLVVAKINGDREIGFPPLVPEVQNRARWLQQQNWTTGHFYSYCRVRLPATGNACFSSPCKNGGTCTDTVGGTFTCSCPPGTTGPRCLIPFQGYELNITANYQWYNIYFDGVEYQVGNGAGNKDSSYSYDSIRADAMPSVIALYYYTVVNHGVLASDSAGFITDASWKCTKTLYNPDFMLPAFNDSAWPTSLVIAKLNGDRDYSPSPVANIHNRAQWVRQSDVTGTYYGFCRVRLSSDGNACFSNPCKNGGTCTNVKGSFSCSCPPALNGPMCINATTNYSLTITVDDNLFDLYLDGIRYDAPNWNLKNVPGTVYTNFRPRLVAAYGNDIGNLKGFLASDNAGLVTGSGWKCTRYVNPNWMLPSYNDSAWPAALVQGRNGNLTAPFNQQYNSGQPLLGISLNAYWIWTAEPVVASLGYVYCRSPLLY